MTALRAPLLSASPDRRPCRLALGNVGRSFVLLLLLGGMLAARAESLSAGQSAAWQQWLMPLPRQVAITGKVTVPLGELHLKLPPPPTDLDRSLAKEFSAALAGKSGRKLELTADTPGAALIIFRRTPAAQSRLGHQRNGSQGYVITATNPQPGQVVVTCDALTEVGSYYAMKTLKQLLLAETRGRGEAATVDLPLGTLVDWPDLTERGQWGGTAEQDLEWLSDLKFNHLELHAHLTLDDHKIGHARLDAKVMERARRHAVGVVPIIHHLEQLAETGMFQAFPQLRAVRAPGADVKPGDNSICFARPEIVTLVSQWMTDLGAIPDVHEVMVWLSEEGKGCQCEECRSKDRFVAELEAITAAWHEARKTCPELGLRVLLSQASYPSNGRILAALEPGVKVSYYHGGLTYNTERKPMIYPLLEEYARSGKWLGVYPTLCANWLSVSPFTNPEFTRDRLTEFVDKGLQNLTAYIVPSDRYYQVNTAGSLEWSWNAHGRSVAAFAASWAVRHGLTSPEKFVAWTKLIGPPAWDMLASSFPYVENWDVPVEQIAAGKMKIGLGHSLFAAFTNEEQFGRNVAQCRQALAVAEELSSSQFIAESRIVLAYARILQSVRELSQILQSDGAIPTAARPAAEQWFQQCLTGVDALSETYPQWDQACFPSAAGNAPEPNRLTATVRMMEKFGLAMSDLMAQHGFPDARRPYRNQVIGNWKTEDFQAEHTLTRRIEVSRLVPAAGTYLFEPVYRSGSLGLSGHEVRLVSFPKDKPEDVREEAVDPHSCHAGAWVDRSLYTLTLKQYDPARGYAIMANFTGGDSSNGDFLFRKASN